MFNPRNPRAISSSILFAALSAPAPSFADDAAEVVVHGDKPKTSALSSDEARQVPGSFGDPLRAVESFPGVTPIATGVPYFYVRGAPPGNVGYFLDGIRIPILFHLAVGPSVIHPSLIDRVELFSGGYPAQYGRFTGGIVTAELRAPAVVPHAEANVRLFDAGALVEAPFESGRGSLLIGGHYSFTGPVLSLFTDSTTLAYRDYQSRVTYDLGPHDRVSLLAFGSFDSATYKSDEGDQLPAFRTEFHRVDMRHDHAFDGGDMRTALTLGLDRTLVGRNETTLRDRMVGLRSDLNWRARGDAIVHAGADVVFDRYDLVGVESPSLDPFDAFTFATEFPSRSQVQIGAHADADLRVHERMTFTPGVRVDAFASDGVAKIGIDPRAALRTALSDKIRSTLAFGIVHQPPGFLLPISGVQPTGLRDGLQRSIQSSTGIEADIAADTVASATFYRNAFYDFTDPIQARRGLDVLINAFNDRNSGALLLLGERLDGSSLGMELALRRRLTRRLGGFLSYTLSRTQVKTADFSAPSAVDRTHVFNAAMAYGLGHGWRIGGRMVFYTGIPPNPDRLNGIRYEFDQKGTLIAERTYHYDVRTPPFTRFDFRLEKRWRVGESASITGVVEIMNAFLAKEAKSLDCDAKGCRPDTIGPITLPSIGVEGAL